jgi:hypothetical protein
MLELSVLLHRISSFVADSRVIAHILGAVTSSSVRPATTLAWAGLGRHGIVAHQE